jgi:ribonuclease R
MTAERKLMDIKKSRLMEKSVGTVSEGIIATITDFGVFVELENFTQGLIRYDDMSPKDIVKNNSQKVKLIFNNGKDLKFKLGQKIKIKVKGIDIAKGLIDLECYEGNSKE